MSQIGQNKLLIAIMYFLSFLLLFCFPPAFAQEQIDYALAKKHFQQGQILFDKGQYAEAAINFEKAYQITKDPVVLSSLAWAQELSGNIEATIETLDTYLPYAPENEKTKLEQRIQSLRDRLAVQQSPESPKEDVSNITEVVAAKAPPKLWVQNTMWGISASSALAGTILGIQARGARTKLSSLCIDDYCPTQAEDLISKDRMYSVLTDICWTISIGTAGTGLWLKIKTNNTISINGRF